MPYELITLEKEGNVATLTLNRPEKLNALNLPLSREAVSVLDEVGKDEGIKALIITGAGEAFSSGGDVREALAGVLEGQPLFETIIGQGFLGKPNPLTLPLQLRNLRKPVIGAINGVAAGAGFSLALACDMRIASEKARFSMAFVMRGLIPDLGGTFFLPKLVGTAKACEIIFTGDMVGAAEAERIGLVNKVVPHGELMKEAKNLANKLCERPAMAILAAKRAIYRGFEEANLAEHIDYELYLQSLLMETEDFKEGVNAFLEKRQPVFKGR